MCYAVFAQSREWLVKFATLQSISIILWGILVITNFSKWTGVSGARKFYICSSSSSRLQEHLLYINAELDQVDSHCALTGSLQIANGYPIDFFPRMNSAFKIQSNLGFRT